MPPPRWQAHEARAARRELNDERERTKAERAAQAERDKRLSKPDIVVSINGYSPESGGLGRIQVTVALENKGDAVAHDVTFGIRIGEHEIATEPGGLHTQQMVAAREKLVRSAYVAPGIWAQTGNVASVMRPWARFSDKLGESYQDEWPPPEP